MNTLTRLSRISTLGLISSGIYTIISNDLFTFKDANDKNLYYDIASYNANSPKSEDEYSISLASTNGTNTSLFGIFDGHTGNEASIFAKNYLLNIILYFFQEDVLYNSFDNTLKYYNDNIEENLKDKIPRYTIPYYLSTSFNVADNIFLNKALLSTPIVQAGSCILVSSINHDNNQIYVANSGDCRAIIGRRIDTTTNKVNNDHVEWISNNSDPIKYNHKAIELSIDAEIGINPNERDRLLANHPYEKDIIRRRRVKGRLQPTRGLGDGTYKSNAFFNARSYRYQEKYNLTGWKAPYTTVEPIISKYTIDPFDEFMILSTDGLFQDVTSQEAVNIVSKYINDLKQKKIPWYKSLFKSDNDDNNNNAAYKLLNHSLTRAIQNISGNSNFNDQKQKMLNVKPGERRKYHDDNTIIVIFFNHEANNIGKTKAQNIKKITLPDEFVQYIKNQ